jgi:hypothetical protein
MAWGVMKFRVFIPAAVLAAGLASATGAAAGRAPVAITAPIPMLTFITPNICLVQGTTPETVTRLKGSPHGTYSIKIIASDAESNIGPTDVADLGGLTKADNGVQQSVATPPDGSLDVPDNGTSINFVAEVLDSSGNVIATSSTSTAVGC